MTSALPRRIGWVTLLVGAIVLLRLAAVGDLGAPPLTSLDALADWTDVRQPASTAMALVRFVAELTAWYLLGLTALYTVAAALRSSGTGALADALALPGAARLVRGGLGLGLLATTAAGATTTGPGDVAVAPSTAVMRPIAPSDDGTARMAPVPDPASPSTSAAAAATTPAPTTTEQTTPQPTTWVVSEGESFWTIAEDALAQAMDRAPTDREVDPYWRRLVDANRERLVDRDDPDLIHPGQVFELPRP